MKTEIVLAIYDKLLRCETIKRKSVCRAYKISERTFYRYIRDISLYLMSYRPDVVIDIREPDGEYYLRTI